MFGGAKLCVSSSRHFIITRCKSSYFSADNERMANNTCLCIPVVCLANHPTPPAAQARQDSSRRARVLAKS